MTREELQADVSAKIRSYQNAVVIQHIHNNGGRWFLGTCLLFAMTLGSLMLVLKTGNLVLLVGTLICAIVGWKVYRRAYRAYRSNSLVYDAEMALLTSVVTYTKSHSYSTLMGALTPPEMSFLARLCQLRRWHGRRIVPFG